MQTQTVTVQEIHDSFFGAGEKALAEAKSLINNPRVDAALRYERFSKLGFTAARPVKEATELVQKQQVAKETVAAIEYFTIHYPQYKFITNEDVKKLCEKYGLMEGGCEQYLGDIPEKNLRDIESFKLRKEDYVEKSFWDMNSIIQQYLNASPMFYDYEPFGFSSTKSRRSGATQAQRLMLPMNESDASKIQPGTKVFDERKEKEQPKFRICAPKSDFNTLGYEVQDGYKLVYDPIVLQPVEYNGIKGNLIITAWGGPEATDETVVNQQMN